MDVSRKDNPRLIHQEIVFFVMSNEGYCKKVYKMTGRTLTGPPSWTRSMDRVHQNYGPGPWAPFMDLVQGPFIFTTPDNIAVINNNKIKK